MSFAGSTQLNETKLNDIGVERIIATPVIINLSSFFMNIYYIIFHPELREQLLEERSLKRSEELILLSQRSNLENLAKKLLEKTKNHG